MILFMIFSVLFQNSIIIYRGDTIRNNEEFMELLKNEQVILIGEKHDDEFTHKLELRILEEVYRESSDSLVLCMEMFEKDIQKQLDKYLEGSISEEEFLKEVRPWSNYESDYRPLVVFAKKNGIPVIASNIPRSISSRVTMGGKKVLDSIIDKSDYIEGPVFLNDSLYRQRFFKTMEQMKGTPMERALKMKENFYYGQCLKDATMAESIISSIDKNYKVLHINGSFHSDYHSGIVYQLKKKKKELDILTIRAIGKTESIKTDTLADITIRESNL